jgi:hypothetical protein
LKELGIGKYIRITYLHLEISLQNKIVIRNLDSTKEYDYAKGYVKVM